jgi:hypothetical protein
MSLDGAQSESAQQPEFARATHVLLVQQSDDAGSQREVLVPQVHRCASFVLQV